MEFKIGDLVEIVTAKYSSWNEIPKEDQRYYENQNVPAPTRGQKFIVKHIHDFLYNSVSGERNGKMILNTFVDDLILIYRNEPNEEIFEELYANFIAIESINDVATKGKKYKVLFAYKEMVCYVDNFDQISVARGANFKI